MYDQASLPLPDGGIGDKERLPKAVRESLEERAAHRVFDLRPMDDALLRRIIAYYYGTISQIDARAADVLEEIETERTLILFHSDHGDYLGRRSRLFKDPNIAYDDLARIPLFMTWPGRVPAGVRVARPVTLADLAPTILEAAGAPVPESVRGESLLKAIARREGRERPAFIETSSSWRFLAVRSGDWKLTMYENGDRELYNLREDPREWRNRAGESEVKEVEEKLAAEITRFRAGG
jgi:choline-sulfatase